MFSSIFNFSSSIEKGSSYVLVYLINSIFSFNNDILSNILFLNYQPPCTESTGFEWILEKYYMLKHTYPIKYIIQFFILIFYIFLYYFVGNCSYSSTKITSRPHMLAPKLLSKCYKFFLQFF